MKLAEGSTDMEEIQLTEAHNRTMSKWGDLSVWQGCVDVVTKHLGTETTSARAGRGNKVAKDFKHLMT